jgi:mandelate racemase
MADGFPTIETVNARGVVVPMKRPLATGGGSISDVPLVLVDLECSDGITGSSYFFCYNSFALKAAAQLVRDLGGLIEGEGLAPLSIHAALRGRMRLLGQQGFAMMASSGIDMAAWDALAKAQGQPLARLLGGSITPVQAYNSNGLGIIGAERAAEEACELVAEGFSAIKLRLGYPDARTDYRVAEAVRKAVGDDIRIMTDYNQSLTASEAKKRVRGLADTDLEWIEEPVRFDDYAGHAVVRGSSPVPIQLGENCWGVQDMHKALDVGAADLFMPDACKIGGVTGWLRAVGVADAIGLPLSSHLYPEISAHLLAVTPTRHWLEYVDWAQPVLNPKIEPVDGHIAASEVPGVGIQWDEGAIAKYRVD